MTKFEIAVVSDNVCPWCYVGKRKLEIAIAEYKERHGSSDEFSTTFKPFFLNPQAPKIGVDKRTNYAEKFGGAERVNQMFTRVAAIGSSVGINFKFAGKIGNSRESHRLVALGGSKSPIVQTRVIDELFAGYFENEQDITSKEFLTAVGVKAGLDQKEVEEWMAGDSGGKEVDAHFEEARRNHISGVPNFTINGKYEIGGAQDPDVFLRVFEKIKAAQEVVKVEADDSVDKC